MAKSEIHDEQKLSEISPERREFVKNAIKLGFVLPAIVTFSMSGLMARPASAASNMS
jgi:hypothetical protein